MQNLLDRLNQVADEAAYAIKHNEEVHAVLRNINAKKESEGSFTGSGFNTLHAMFDFEYVGDGDPAVYQTTYKEMTLELIRYFDPDNYTEDHWRLVKSETK